MGDEMQGTYYERTQHPTLGSAQSVEHVVVREIRLSWGSAFDIAFKFMVVAAVFQIVVGVALIAAYQALN